MIVPSLLAFVNSPNFQIMVLIWNFLQDMYGHEGYECHGNNTINDSLLHVS